MRYVCVLSTNNYLDGVLILNENLKRVNSKYPLLCLINENIGKEEREILDFFQIEYKELPSIKYSKAKKEWQNTFDKFNVFSLTEYDKIVYLDCDMLIRSNIDELFEIDEFTMANDVPYSDYTNSAIMVIKPNIEDYEKLKARLVYEENNNRIEIGDQEIIRDYFPNAKKLDNSYNLMRTISKDTDIFWDIRLNNTIEKHPVLLGKKKCVEEKVIHYIFPLKPWMLDKPYDDNYYYEYKNILDDVRIKKANYYIYKKKLLVVSNITTIKDNEIKMLESLKEQTFPNIHFLFISNNINEIKEYIDSIKLKNVTYLSNSDNLEEIYSNYDYITEIEPVIYLTKDCYEECLKYLALNFLDCAQFCDDSQFNYNYKIYKDENTNPDSNNAITKNNYDKIYKREFINKKNEIKSIGIVGNLFYYSLNK